MDGEATEHHRQPVMYDTYEHSTCSRKPNMTCITTPCSRPCRLRLGQTAVETPDPRRLEDLGTAGGPHLHRLSSRMGCFGTYLPGRPPGRRECLAGEKGVRVRANSRR